MKRDRHAKGEQLLLEAENTLRKSLLEILLEVIKSGEMIFMNSQFNPHALPSHLLSKRGEALFELATACVEMREALGLTTIDSIGHLFLESCSEAASSTGLSGLQRPSPRSTSLMDAVPRY
jgi:hypothetical protein